MKTVPKALANIAVGVCVAALIALLIISGVRFENDEVVYWASIAYVAVWGAVLVFSAVILPFFKFGSGKVNESISNSRNEQAHAELLRLSNLFKEGALSKEEFDAKANKLKELIL